MSILLLGIIPVLSKIFGVIVVVWNTGAYDCERVSDYCGMVCIFTGAPCGNAGNPVGVCDFLGEISFLLFLKTELYGVTSSKLGILALTEKLFGISHHGLSTNEFFSDSS